MKGELDKIKDIHKMVSEFSFGAYLGNGCYGHGDDEQLVSDYSMQSPRQVLESRQGTCIDIAGCVKYLLDREGIRNFAVYGIYDDGSEFPPNHCFNVAFVDGRMYLVDASDGVDVSEYGSLDDVKRFYSGRHPELKGAVFHRLDSFPPAGSSFWNFVEYADGCREI